LNRNAVKNEKEANSKTEPDQKVESSQKKVKCLKLMHIEG
jgi:hypothetical protein